MRPLTDVIDGKAKIIGGNRAPDARLPGFRPPVAQQPQQKHGGSEHGTPGHVRDEFDRMLRDAEKGGFDAICIADLQRWSRDTVAHEQAVRRLKVTRQKAVRAAAKAAEPVLAATTISFRSWDSRLRASRS